MKEHMGHDEHLYTTWLQVITGASMQVTYGKAFIQRAAILGILL